MKKKKVLTVEQEQERTRKLSVKEGSLSMAASGFGDSYITPLAIALKSSNFLIGLLGSFPSLIAPIFQILGSNLMEKFSRKKIITIGVIIQALMWIPIMILSILMWKGIWVNFLPIFLIVFYSLYAILGSISGPAWFSLMGDVVPEKIRGRYFSFRNKITGAVGILATITTAFILDFFKTKGLILLGFSLIFFIACLCRLFAGTLFPKHYDNPKFKLKDGYYFSFWSFLKKAPTNNFGRFVIYVAMINMVTAIAGPFFAVYMLNNLGFSYTTFMLVNISASLVSFLVFPYLGKISDKYGNRELLKFGSVLVPLLPILWLFGKSPAYLILVPQLISGIGWAAFNLAASNFIYDCVTPQRRALCVSYFNVMNGLGIFIGGMAGGVLAQYLHVSFMNSLLLIFLISGVLRAIVVVFMFPTVREVRQNTKKAKSNPILYLKELRPMRGLIHIIVHDIEKFRRKKK